MSDWRVAIAAVRMFRLARYRIVVVWGALWLQSVQSVVMGAGEVEEGSPGAS
jgi:hypothetical protein